MTSRDARRLAMLAHRVGRIQSITAAAFAELQEILARNAVALIGPGPLPNLLGSDAHDSASLFLRPVVDAGAMTVTWRGRSCSLRNKVLFNLLDRLARRPGHLVHYDRLLRDAWEGQTRADETIRNAVYRLKVRLRDADMADLAAAIQSSGRRCGLMLDFPSGLDDPPPQIQRRSNEDLPRDQTGSHDNPPAPARRSTVARSREKESQPESEGHR
jgi:hypothetical protein